MTLDETYCFPYFHFSSYRCILQAQIHTTMNNLILGAFYDNVNKNVGPTLMWVFTLLLTIEILYAMFKYLGTDESK